MNNEINGAGNYPYEDVGIPFYDVKYVSDCCNYDTYKIGGIGDFSFKCLNCMELCDVQESLIETI